MRSFRKRDFRLLAIAALSLALGAAAAVGQEGAGILEKAKKDYDDFLRRAKDLKVVSSMTTITPAGTTMTRSTAYYKGDKSRIETRIETQAVQGGLVGAAPIETAILDDGEHTWMVSTYSPKRKVNDQEAMNYGYEHIWLRAFPENAEVAGEEEYGGRDCYVVEIREGAGLEPVTIWLDKESLVVVGGKGSIQGKNLRWVHSDFREVEGREMPYATAFYSGEDLVGTMEVESVETDSGLSDDFFTADKLKVGEGPSEEELRERWNSSDH